MTTLLQAPPIKKGHWFRPDIEGLRAVAVVLVILNHLGGAPAGGYIGVDVFFVISGYLITSQLVREHAKTGWISLGAFYARRLRRIVPVATVVALIIIIVGYLLWFLPQANQTALDGLSALLWVANWHFAGVGTDYLQATGPISPFQHYWSLSVEEQFYVFWPWLIIGCGLFLTRVLKTSPRRALFIGVTAVAVLSFVWSLGVTQWRPTLAYFDTISRAWEFAVGALLAIVPVRQWASARAWTRWLPMVGVGIIVAGAVALSADSAFPGPWAALPVVGAALIIGGNDRDAGLGPGMLLLSNPVARYLGRISYSLYLWHFPVIIFLEVLFPTHSVVALMTMCVTMLSLSHLSHRYIEEPIRHSGWLRSWESSARDLTSPWSRVKQLAASGMLATTLGVLAVAQLAGPAAVTDAAAARSLVTQTSTAGATHTFESEDTLTAALQRATAEPQDLGSVTPSLNRLGPDQQAPAMDTLTGCRNTVGTTNPQLCEYGSVNATKTALVIGDSIAMSWMPTITGALPEDWKVIGLGYASCSPYDIDTLPRNAPSTFVSDCRANKEIMWAKVEELAPDLVVLSSGHSELADGSTGEDAVSAWKSAVQRTVTRLAEDASAVAVLSAPPYAPDMRQCAQRVSGVEDCAGTSSEKWENRSSAEAAGVAAAESASGRTSYVPNKHWFCTDEGICPAIVGKYVVRTDTIHLTNAYAESLAQVAAPYFLGYRTS